MAEERLQKILARAGIASRRASEELIVAGRVIVNGKRAELGSKADVAKDHILVDGNRVTLPQDLVYIAIYKPRGVLSTTAGPDPRQKITDLVPDGNRLHMVGRLDKDSEGLMILTSDGELTQRLSHPRYEQEKEYRVLVARKPDGEQLGAWRRGVVLPDGTRTRAADVKIADMKGKGAWLRVVMHEGHKRQIREIAATLGLPVAKLIRVRIASLRLGKMQPAEWRNLDADEVAALKSEKPFAGPKPAKSRRPNRSSRKAVSTKARPGGPARKSPTNKGLGPKRGFRKKRA
jgi:23S rRNA pseudouridine2605 synthase